MLCDYITTIAVALQVATGIAESALMFARKVAIRQKRVFDVGYLSGSADLSASIKGRNNTHDWQISEILQTLHPGCLCLLLLQRKAKTIVYGLKPGKTVYSPSYPEQGRLH